MNTENDLERTKPKNHLRRRIILSSAIFLAIVLTTFLGVYLISNSIFDTQRYTRFDPGMPEAEANRIRDAAFEADDAETYLAIHEDWFENEAGRPFVMNWDRLSKIARQTGSIRKTASSFESLRKMDQEMRLYAWNHDARLVNGKSYSPRVIEAASKRFGEKWRRFTGSTSLQPDFLGYSALQNLFWLYVRQGRSGESVDTRWLMMAATPGDSLLTSILYQILLHNDLWIDSEKLASYRAQRPDDIYIRRSVGIYYWKNQKFDKAEPLLSQSMTDFDDDPLGRYALAESRRALGQDIDPVEIMGNLCVNSIHFATQESTRLTFRAKLHRSLGNLNAAKADTEAAIKIDPLADSAWELLSEVCLELHDPVTAKTARERYEELSAKRTKLKEAVQAYITHRQKSTEFSEELFSDVQDGLREVGWELPLRLIEYRDQTLKKTGTGDPAKFLSANPLPAPDRFFLPRPVAKSKAGERGTRSLGDPKK
jgi:tetratricopeptide (TPR) repeat protein